MVTDRSIADVARLLADTARVSMLWALADGRPRPAGALARQAGIAASTASEHLARLLAGGLIAAERHGRHRFYRVSGAHVVALLESLGALATPSDRPASPASRASGALRHARTCYDHLAGALGVAVTEALVARGALALADEQFAIPHDGESFWRSTLGVDLDAARASRRQFARACLDWTERRHHLAGALGAALLDRLRERRWLEAMDGTRALQLTPAGRRALRETFGIDPMAGRY